MDAEDHGLALRVPMLTLCVALVLAIAILWFLPDDKGVLQALSGGGFVHWWVIQGILWLWLVSLCAWSYRHRARHAGIVILLLVIALGLVYARPGGWYAMAVPEPSFEGMKVGYWDGQLYWDSAIAYRNGDNPFRINWYPPTFLKTFALLTHTTPASAFAIWWLVVAASFLLSVVFSYELLLRWQITPVAATVLCGLLWLANSPAVLTMSELQVNLIMLGFMLMSYLYLDRSQVLSAAGLALAAALKVSPIVVSTLVVLTQRKSYVLLWLLSSGLLVGATLFGDGIALWQLFLTNVAHKTWSSGSLDTLCKGFLGAYYGNLLAAIVKIVILTFSLVLAWKWRHHGLPDRDQSVVSSDAAFAVGCACMVLIAPAVWPYHRVWFVPPLLFCWVYSHYRWLPVLWISTALLLWLPMIPHLGIANVLPPGLMLLWCLRPAAIADNREDTAIAHVMRALTAYVGKRDAGQTT